MKTNKLKLAIFIAIPLLVGIIAGLLTRNATESFSTINQPPLSPPAILFPIVWTILYILMGISSYLISEADAAMEEKAEAQSLYFYQLIVNFLWPIFFFNLGWYLFSLIWLILLWILVFLMIRKYYEISKLAAFLNIPYLIWLTFAAYLNIGVWLLN